MTNNLPPKYDAVMRQGATFGPVTFVVSGLDLTNYNLVGGIGKDNATPTLTKSNGTTFTMIVPPAITSTLTAGSNTTSETGKHALWIDAVSATDTTVVIPLVGGSLRVMVKGAHD